MIRCGVIAAIGAPRGDSAFNRADPRRPTATTRLPREPNRGRTTFATDDSKRRTAAHTCEAWRICILFFDLSLLASVLTVVAWLASPRSSCSLLQSLTSGQRTVINVYKALRSASIVATSVTMRTARVARACA